MKRPELSGYLFALGAALTYGITAIIIREGTQRFGVVLPGLSVALLVGLLAMGSLNLRSGAWRQRPPRRAVLFVLASGLTAAVGIGSQFVALSQLPVSVVTPISSTYPLVTLLLARLFLQRSERVTWRTALGAACVVGGVVLVVLGRAG